jgi:hypothetical protein
MTSLPSPSNRRRRRIVVVVVAGLAGGLCWWLGPNRDWLNYLPLSTIALVAYGIGRYLIVTIRDLTRTLRCNKGGQDSLQVAISGT